MNKLFYFLLFCSVSGAGVLWWLMHAVGGDEIVATETQRPQGLVIRDAPRTEEILGADSATLDEDSEAAEKIVDQMTPLNEAVGPSTLTISSDPEKVEVYLDGKRVGQTPFEAKLKKEVQKFRFEKEGFVPVEREAPAELVPEGAYLSWRISMVKQELPPAQRARLQDVASYFLKGVSGPVFVQVKSVAVETEPRSQVVNEIDSMRKMILEDKVFACEVSLGDKGLWYRYLVGPFETRREAQQALGFLRERLKTQDLFVTGAQSCR
jgi:hypothetical protein